MNLTEEQIAETSDQMELDLEEPLAFKEPPKPSRHTIFQQNPMNVTNAEHPESPSIQETLQRSRKTASKSFVGEIMAIVRENERIIPSQETYCSQDIKASQETVCTQEERYSPEISYRTLQNQNAEVKKGLFHDILETGVYREQILSQEAQKHEQSSIQVSVIQEVPKIQEPEPEDTCFFDVGKLGQKTRNSMLLKRQKKVDDENDNGLMVFNVEIIPDRTVDFGQEMEAEESIENQTMPHESFGESMEETNQQNPTTVQENPKISIVDFEQGECSKYQALPPPDPPRNFRYSGIEMEGFAKLQESLKVGQDLEESSTSRRCFRPSNMYDENDVKFSQSFHRTANENMEDKQNTFVVCHQEPEPGHQKPSRPNDSEVIFVSDSDTTIKPDSLLENESSPCVQEEEGGQVEQSEYYKNFINLTVTNLLSPATTIESPRSEASSLISSPATPSGPTLLERFQEFCGGVEQQRDQRHQRLLQDIGDFVNQIQVPAARDRPTITPQSIRDYFKKRNAQVLQNVERMLTEQAREEENREKQYPEIPSQSFLIQNWLDNLDEELEAKIKAPALAPIFPEDRDFLDLIKNKIEW
jgi:hypothetical protein